MKNLLFLPLDIEVININFPHSGLETYHQNFWTTENVEKVGDDYDNHRWLLDQFSLDKVTTFTHKIQNHVVAPHVDVFGYESITPEIQQTIDNEPAGFHVVLKGKPDSLEIFTGTRWVNPILPKVPCVYLLNLTSCYHKVKEDPLRETLYIRGIINVQKHRDLINKNLEKYRHLAVFRE